jgi:integrase
LAFIVDFVFVLVIITPKSHSGIITTLVILMNTFKDYAQLFLDDSKSENAHSSFVSNRSKVNNLLKTFGKRKISSIKHSEIKIWKRKVSKKLSNKTINDHYSILRKIFKIALNDGVISINPMQDIETLPLYKVIPNPFEKDELIALKKTETDCVGEKNLVFLGVITGLRMCELLSLSWDCVDFDKAEIQVNKAVVLGNYKLPKTEESLRKVELNQYAIYLLRQQFELTGSLRSRVIRVLQSDNQTKVKQTVQHVFVSTKTKKPFSDVKEFTTKFFKGFLVKAGVKKRGANQVRHTFASQSLVAGISMEWIRIQMGHTTTHMIEKHYGKWMNADAPDYSQKLGQALSSVFNSGFISAECSTIALSSWGAGSNRKSITDSFSSCKVAMWEVSRCA